MEIQFIDYVEVKNEKYLGIATIMYNNMLLRYKIQPKKETKGFYAKPAVHKITENGVDRYVDSFVIDSRIENDKIIKLIQEEVTRRMLPVSAVPGSVFDNLPF
jgi:hypothetical protein